MKTPLAWKNLTASWNKCALAAAGVGFAVVLMFMQIGFQNALIDNNVQLFSILDIERANIAVVSRARYSLATELRFPKVLLEQLAGMPSVRSVGTISIERGTSQIKVIGYSARPIRVVALDTGATDMLNDASLIQRLQAADRQDACLIDSESKSTYGLADSESLLQQQRIEMNGQILSAVGHFRLGTDFSNDGTVLMSQRIHAKFFPWRSPSRKPEDLVDIGLLHVQTDGQQPLQEIAQSMQQQIGQQVSVMPTQLLIAREKKFWAEVTPIGKIFAIGTLMGFLVGAIICYQIQFTDITDHMSELATLKAMGYSGAYFWKLVLSQSFYLACLGFLPGLLISYILYQLLAKYSGLVMMMTWERLALVWLLTLVMCAFSGAIAIRKLFSSDPANLF